MLAINLNDKLLSNMAGHSKLPPLSQCQLLAKQANENGVNSLFSFWPSRLIFNSFLTDMEEMCHSNQTGSFSTNHTLL